MVFISSELEEVVRLSDRIVVLKDHRKIAEIANGPDVTAESIVDIIADDGASDTRHDRRHVEEIARMSDTTSRPALIR